MKALMRASLIAVVLFLFSGVGYKTKAQEIDSILAKAREINSILTSARRACVASALGYTVRVSGTDSLGHLVSLGGGFYTKRNGRHYVFSGAHLSDRYQPSYVHFNDGTRKPVSVVLRGLDRAPIDFALLELVNVDSLTLPQPARLGNSDNLFNLDKVFVVSALMSGNDIELETPEASIAVPEEILTDSTSLYQQRLIRVHTSTFGGSSGGPLVSIDGCAVVGMTVSSLLGSVFVNGTPVDTLKVRVPRTFAVPINDILRVLPRLESTDGVVREVIHADIGFGVITCIYPEPICPPGSVLVKRVREDSEASRAGVRSGDVIKIINAKPVEDLSDFFDRVTFDYWPGDTVEILVSRKDPQNIGQYVDFLYRFRLESLESRTP